MRETAARFIDIWMGIWQYIKYPVFVIFVIIAVTEKGIK